MLAEKILKALDANEYNETKLNTIKTLVLDEMRLQALKATPGKTKLSTELTRMYKDTLKSDSYLCHGYVKMPAGFVITDAHFLIHVDGNPLELLPADAMENKKLTQDSVNRLIKSVDMHDRQDLKVNYSDIVNHFKIHGRKKTNDNAFFTIPGTKYIINVFYIEYAFKLTGKKELTFSVKGPKELWYLKGADWTMLITPMVNNNKEVTQC